jgi:hypothetical protein
VEQRYESVQHPERAQTGGRIARTQHRGAEILLGLAVEGQKGQQRQIAPGVVVPVEKRELLRPMRGIVSRIEIDRDAARTAMQPSLVPVDDADRQIAARLIQRRAIDPVFKPREGRLRGEREAGDRIAVEQQLLNRIVRQTVGIVRIGIPARDPEHPLCDKFVDGVLDSRRHPAVRETPRHGRRDTEPRVGRLQQDRPAIRTRMRLIEGGDERLGEQVRKENSLWYRVVGQTERLRGEGSLCGNSFLSRGGVCFCTNPSSLVNYPG